MPNTLLVPLIDATLEQLFERDGSAGVPEAIALIVSTMVNLDKDDQKRLLLELVSITLQGRIDRYVELKHMIDVPGLVERRVTRWTPDGEREWESFLAQRTFDA